ncbi:outer membrane protein OmpA-like peptidoglycan-associated protein/tetratricopeptide (TPR) repeat protein [Arcicella rosea]|uniref:OmpA family protein n=1 Tax=Arcicella rosea TaxID=502909 RepID=UPI00345D1BDA
MNNKILKIRLLLFVFFICTFGNLYAQTKLKEANYQFEKLSYLEAIRQYEDFLKENKDPKVKLEILKKLAFSYRKIQDTRNAERVFSNLIKDFPDVESEQYLYYAQALASNQKYRESQKYYSLYGEKQKADLRGKRFTISYMDMSHFYRDSSSYKVEYLSINSRQADFSPMYYNGGLVFSSARDEAGIIKRVFGWNQTPFLNLYFVADTALLSSKMGLQSASAVGGMSASNNETLVQESPLSKIEDFSRILNTKYHEGPVSFFKDGKKVIFTRNNYNKGRARESKDGTNRLKLYSANLNKESWSNVKELPFNNDEFSCGHPALNADNTKLYFVSDMPGGFGGTDIYIVEYNDGKWGKPINAGREINTEGNEMFPFVDENNNLYFASDGHEGLGGLDIFFAEYKDGKFSETVVNVGAPLNSEKDDFGLITDGGRNSGYFSSNRKKGIHDDNIYSFKKECHPLNIVVYDALTKLPLADVDIRSVINGENQELKITNSVGLMSICLQSLSEYEFKAIKEGYLMNAITFSTRSNTAQNTTLAIYLEKSNTSVLKGIVKSEVNQKPIAGVQVTLENQKDKTKQTVITGEDGGYEFEVKPDTENKLIAEKDNYATNNEVIKSTENNASPLQNVQKMYAKGDVIRLKNIYYDRDKFFIRTDAALELEKTILPILQKYPSMKVEIRSHTDSRSSASYNLELSQKRAKAVVDFLVENGIDTSRLMARGYGETEPINECVDGVSCSEEQHQENRRTEFKILSVK